MTNITDTLAATDSSLIANRAGTITITLQNAASYPGRWLYVKTVTNNALTSNASNVVPRTTTAAGTPILAATAGTWASLQSDGTNWVVMSGN